MLPYHAMRDAHGRLMARLPAGFAVSPDGQTRAYGQC